MFIKSFRDTKNKIEFLSADKNGREISLYKLNNFYVVSENLSYPNVLFFDGNQIVTPTDEKVMSLGEVEFVSKYSLTDFEIEKSVDFPVFYFIYNTDNYYHFIYDTIPYLISYFELKKNLPNLKLLVSYSHDKNSFYKFNYEFFELCGLKNEDFVFIEKKVSYNEIYISDSYTYGKNPNAEPRDEVYEFLMSLVSKNKETFNETPKKIYVSRRSHIHNDLTNIGTNYTERRKMMNENELVSFLVSLGFVEVFTETMSTIEKINIFKNAEIVVGPIGGGLCNVLFSPKKTKVLPIISPTFLDVNKRFNHCFKNTDTQYFLDTYHNEKSFFKKNMRVKYKNIIGEITKIVGNNVEIIYSENLISGWSKDYSYKKIIVPTDEITKLDDGINSEWLIDINEFKKFYGDRFYNVSSGIH